VKFEAYTRFDREFQKLPKAHRMTFYAAIVPQFNEAAQRAAAGEANPWPAGLRVKKVQGVSGVWEMTWSMDNPDGRATWEWAEIDGEPAVRWRRIGTHRIFADP
jgi:hypothetical protein